MSKAAEGQSLFGTHAGARIWLCLDPCGLTCVAFVYMLVIGGVYIAAVSHAAQGAARARQPPRPLADAPQSYVVIPWLGATTAPGLLHLTALLSLAGLAISSHVRGERGTLAQHAAAPTGSPSPPQP